MTSNTTAEAPPPDTPAAQPAAPAAPEAAPAPASAGAAPAAPAPAPAPAPGDAPAPPPADGAAPAPGKDPAKPDAPAAPPASGWKPAKNTWLTIIVFLVVIAAGIAIILWVWQLGPFASADERTEDAYVQGLTTTISPQVSGYVARVMVEDFAIVERGQVLLVIDQSSYLLKVAQSRATLDTGLANLANNVQTIAQYRAAVAAQDAAIGSAQVNLIKTRSDASRTDDLVRDGSVSRKEAGTNTALAEQAAAAVTQAVATREQAVQQVRSAQVNGGALGADVEGSRAALASSQLDLTHTIIRAPVAGQLSTIGAKLGQYVTAGTALTNLVPGARWVTANYKEAQTRHMTPGQPAWFAVDGLGGARVTGRVARMAPATGSQFAVLKPDNATGNFTKVPQRIQVLIELDPGQPLIARLRPGMSVETHIDTRGGPGDRRDQRRGYVSSGAPAGFVTGLRLSAGLPPVGLGR